MATSTKVNDVLAQIDLIKNSNLSEEERIKLLEASKSLTAALEKPKDIIPRVVHNVRLQKWALKHH
jgi:hypothetical protein